MKFISSLFDFIFSKKFLYNLGLLVVVYLVVMIVTIYYLNARTNHGEKIKVQNYIGQNISQVKGKLSAENIKFEVVDSVYDGNKPEGTIIYQRPLPTDVSGTYIKSERKIYFRVSKKSQLVEVPSMVDRSERYAVSVLQNMGMKSIVSYTPSKEAAGAVLEQIYRGRTMGDNKKIPIGSTITLVVGQALNEADVALPDLSCLTINDVKSRLQDGSIVINENYVNCRTHADSTNAMVISQNPAFQEGVTLPYGSTISVTLDAKGCH